MQKSNFTRQACVMHYITAKWHKIYDLQKLKQKEIKLENYQSP